MTALNSRLMIAAALSRGGPPLMPLRHRPMPLAFRCRDYPQFRFPLHRLSIAHCTDDRAGTNARTNGMDWLSS